MQSVGKAENEENNIVRIFIGLELQSSSPVVRSNEICMEMTAKSLIILR